MPAFAAVLSDYGSSAIAVLGPTGEPIRTEWVTSATREPELVTAVSGDVVLPAHGMGPRLAWIDRYGVDVITLLSLPGARPAEQRDLRGDEGGLRTGFSPNPQDAVYLPDGRLAISRLNPNPDASAPPLALGNDVVVLAGEGLPAARVSIGCDATLPDGRTAFARPASLAPLRTASGRPLLLVGLARLSADFRSAAEGAVAVLDAVTLAPLGCVPLPDARNCASVAADPADPARAMVLCGGDAFAPPDVRAARSGLFELVLRDDASAEIAARAPVHRDGRVAGGGLVALGAGLAVVVADGRGGSDALGVPDALLLVDARSGTSSPLAEASAFSLGQGAFAGPPGATAGTGTLLVPSADARSLLRFTFAEGRLTTRDEVPLLGCSALPPRQVAPVGVPSFPSW